MSDLRFEDSAPRRDDEPASARRRESNSPGRRPFRLNKDRKKFLGVCAGIADYFDIDVTIVRVLWVIGTLVGFGSLVAIYIAIALIAD